MVFPCVAFLGIVGKCLAGVANDIKYPVPLLAALFSDAVHLLVPRISLGIARWGSGLKVVHQGAEDVDGLVEFPVIIIGYLSASSQRCHLAHKAVNLRIAFQALLERPLGHRAQGDEYGTKCKCDSFHILFVI